jgi:hypothetical protein
MQRLEAHGSPHLPGLRSQGAVWHTYCRKPTKLDLRFPWHRIFTDSVAHLIPDRRLTAPFRTSQSAPGGSETLGVALATLLGYGYCHYMTK